MCEPSGCSTDGKGMGMKRIALVSLALVGSCSGEKAVEKEAKEVVSHDLRDPSSAQFRDIKIYPSYVCGEINGKNGMGAYVGFRRFWMDRESKAYGIDPGTGDGGDLERQGQKNFEDEMTALCK